MIKRIKVHTEQALNEASYRFPGNYGVEKFLELFSGTVSASPSGRPWKRGHSRGFSVSLAALPHPPASRADPVREIKRAGSRPFGPAPKPRLYREADREGGAISKGSVAKCRVRRAFLVKSIRRRLTPPYLLSSRGGLQRFLPGVHVHVP